MHESRKGRDVVLTFKDHLGPAIYEACKHNYEKDGICLSSAAKIVRNQILQHIKGESDWLENNIGAEGVPVPKLLVTLISMIIGGSSVLDNISTAESKVAINIAQLVHFNVVKHKRRKTAEMDKLRYSKALETPLPLYIGLLIHAKTRKKGMVNTFAHKGLSVSYDRVQDVQLSITKQLCKKYSEDGFVCPPSLKEDVFTTAVVDNIDHDPTSSTATKSFHGPSLSIFQHPEEAPEPNKVFFNIDVK